MDYKSAGVNIEEAYKAVAKYTALAAGTANSAVLGRIGSFAGLLSLKDFAGLEEPVLVSGADGVGTKLAIAFRLKKYDTVGIDCVAMCVNDVICHGARPLFFLDYLACGKLDAAVAAELVKGVARACCETGMVLLGGETAEMPGFYAEGTYDIAGFCVGIVDRKDLIDGSNVRLGDTLVGIASSGVHSNGFSLIRKVLPHLDEDFGGMPLGVALLEPTRLYAKPIMGLIEMLARRGAQKIHGIAHITGGGFYENIPRLFNASAGSPVYDASINLHQEQWRIPPIFGRIAYGIFAADMVPGSTTLTEAAAQDAGSRLLQTDAHLRKVMFNTFNMGIGLVLALAPETVPAALEYLDAQGFPAWPIGNVSAAAGEKSGVRFEA
ncbi:phosphoribosylformylglycinamidine cyclo-ligase [Breznakiellaceae bacterium SP9]